MNGVHDMGGMQCMGPIAYEKNEPVFHAHWEGRVQSLAMAMRAMRKWDLDATRYHITIIPPAEYLRLSYYEKTLAALIEQLVKSGQATRAEIESGVPATGGPKATPALTPGGVLPMLSKGTVTSRDARVDPRFKVGQRVRARNMNPTGHTRLPLYVRAKLGTIERDHGVFVFPDTNAHLLGEKPQHVYSVRFAARELWGEQAAPRDSVYVDLWDDYLERAQS